MNTRVAYIALCGVCFALLGCASEQRRFTGFLHDYSMLKPDPDLPWALVYWNPDIDPKQYKAVIIEPVEVHFKKRGDQERANPEDVAAFCNFVTAQWKTVIRKYAPVVTKPGKNVLRCRLQVANLQFTRSVSKPQYGWLPQDYAVGSANIETEARDSISGELVVAYVGPQGSVEIYTPPLLAGPPGRWEPAKEVVRDRIGTWTDHAARYFVSE